MFTNAAQTLKRQTPAQRHILDFVRRESTARHFYQNRQLELYASKEAQRLTLRQLVRIIVGPRWEDNQCSKCPAWRLSGLLWATYD